MSDDTVGPQAVKSRCRKPFKTIDLISATTKKIPKKQNNKQKEMEGKPISIHRPYLYTKFKQAVAEIKIIGKMQILTGYW